MRRSRRTKSLATQSKSLATKRRGDNTSVSSSQPGIHDLPVELLDLILQSLWEDKRSILACSSVSRLWHEVAHPHLFAFLKIASQFDFVDFHAFLHANTDIARHVRKLQLKHTVTRWMSRVDLPDGFPGVGRAQLRDLVASLPHLQELHLYELWVMSPANPPDAPNSLPTHRLETLTIENCGAPDRDLPLVTVLDIVSLFASIDTVKLVSLRFPTVPHDPARVIRAVRVSTLVIMNMRLQPQFEASALYNPLRESLVPGCLRSLEIECLRSEQPELWSRGRVITDRVAREPQGLRSFGRLVESAARDALHIYLPFRVSSPVGPGEDNPEHWRILNLHACTSLTSLTLEITVPPTRKPESSRDIPRVPLADVCIALFTVIPATVRVLAIKLWGANEPAAVKSEKTLGLRALDAALAERHAHLERVEVTLGTYTDVDRLEALTRAMPKLRRYPHLTGSSAAHTLYRGVRC